LFRKCTPGLAPILNWLLVIVRILLTEVQLRDGVARLAHEINAAYEDHPLTIVSVLTGSIVLLADLIRLQLLGVMWAATGIDHVVPESYEPLQVELEKDLTFQEYGGPGDLSTEELALNVLEAGTRLLGDIPILFVNEPILIASGENSDLRYNSFYPRWAYDEYHEQFGEKALEKAWNYVDLWDVVPAEKFTDSAIHYSPEGVTLVIDQLSDSILQIVNQAP
jgi:hypothetical protein